MAFTKRKLMVVRNLAQQVAHKANELIEALDTETRYSRDESGQWGERAVHPTGHAPMDANFITGTRATGEFRRLTMDLTRALADARRS